MQRRGNQGIAIIDSGIDATHQCLTTGVAGGIHIHKPEQGTLVFDQELNDVNGHGTAVAGLIHTIHPQAPIYIVKLSAADGIVTEEMLVEGLLWCIHNKDIRIVNVSMGIKSQFYTDKLYIACRDAYRKNKIIVAAVHSNPYRECYPAYFPFVLGVCSGFARKAEFRWLGRGKGVNVVARGSNQRVPWIGNAYQMLSGTSLACANFTAALSKLIASNATYIPKKDWENLLSGKSNDLIIPLKYFNTPMEPPTGVKYLKNYQDAAQRLKSRKIMLYPASDPEIGYLYQCWSAVSRRSLQLKDHSYNDQKQKAGVKRLSDTDLIVIGGSVADWPDEKILLLHKLINKALRQNTDLLLLNKVLVRMAAAYINGNFKTYKGCIYTSVPVKRTRRADTPVATTIAKRMALIGMNIPPGLLMDAEKKIRAVLQVRGNLAYTITTDDYFYFLGANRLLSNPLYFQSTPQTLKKAQQDQPGEIKSSRSKAMYRILLINEKVESHYRMNHQIQLGHLHNKLVLFDPDTIVVVTDSDAEKQDLKDLLYLFCNTMPGRTLFVGYWSNTRPHITRNFQLSIKDAEIILPYLNLDNTGNWQTISDIIV